MDIQTVLEEIDRLRDEMTRTLIDLIRIPAIGPESDGEGELKKAEKLLQICKAIGFDEIQRHDVPDDRVPHKSRPNIFAFLKGETSEERLWIVTHMDIVPPGEESLWTITKPFEPIVKDGKVYGRGSEDNTQPMVSSIFAMKALKNLKIKPKRTVALSFVADEELGSKYGIEYLIGKGLFKRKDLVVVPDSGNGDGSFIEVAEKSSIWLKVNTIGKQAHASRPGDGLNAHRAGMQFALAVDRMLHERYADKDALFDPPSSTFEPTKKDRNVDAINIVPGEDTIYFDGRILPRYDVEELLKNVIALARDHEKNTGAKIGIEVVNKNIAAPPTDANAKIALMLKEAIEKTRQKDVKVGGIGGGTCANFFRKAGIPAAVWATMDETAHQPNEYAKIDNMVNDAKVFAYMATLN